MRLAPTLFLPSLLVPLVSAHARPGGSLHSSQSRSLSRLQHHEPRLIDLCVNIDDLIVNLLGSGGLLNIGGAGTLIDGLLGAQVDACLCLHDLDIYLNASASVTSKSNAVAVVNALIDTADNTNVQCGPLPAHAKRACTTSDPCMFTCDAPYKKHDDQCVCALPNVVCNGQCGPPIAGCGASQSARSLKSRRAEISTYEEAKAYCGKSEVCGVYGKPKGWECVDVTQSPECCGGCALGHPFLPKSGAPLGVDCGSISNAKHVTCQNSKCVVRQCEEGYTVSPAGTKCLPADHESRRDLLGLIHINDAPTASTSVAPVGEVLDPGLGSTLAGVLASASALSNAKTSLPASGCVTSSAADDVLISVRAVVGTLLVADIKVAITKCADLQKAAKGCSATDGDAIKNIGTPVPAVSRPPFLAPPSDSCLVVDTSKLLGSLLAPVQACGALATLLHNLLQSLVDDLGLGPAPGGALGPVGSALGGVLGGASDSCLVVDTSKFLGSLLGPVRVCRELGALLHNLLQNLVTSLGLGPAGGAIASVGGAPASASASIPVAKPGDAKQPIDAKPPIDINLSLKRGGFRTRSGHFARADASSPRVLASDMVPLMMRTLALTSAIRDTNTPSCEPLLTTLIHLFGSSSSNTLNANLDIAVTVANTFKGSADPKLSNLVDELLAALTAMQKEKSPTVAGPSKCPSADTILPVCGLGFPISEFISCGCGTQKLPADIQAILGAIPPDAPCSRPNLSAASLITTSLPPATLSSDSSAKVIPPANALLALCLKIDLAGGNMPFRLGVIGDLNKHGINPLLMALVGPDLLTTGTTGTLGGAVADILSGSNTLSVDGLKKLVDTVLDLLAEARGGLGLRMYSKCR
ncbi:hypothetical protein MVEN_00235500 [Mycena venus]|uniref:Protein CPL1-like domain-containing protein n=1 Tax=Mycena venus TaxID=2733690 RepID=A0A8H7DC83_9AGAR|nr:hypothetical protein MVEN_00235500 [Mycena venus]